MYSKRTVTAGVIAAAVLTVAGTVGAGLALAGGDDSPATPRSAAVTDSRGPTPDAQTGGVAAHDDRGVQAEPGDDPGVHAEPGDDRGVHAEPGDDHGVHAEPADDHGVHAEPGDDHGVHAEPGDDHGGRSHSGDD